MIGNPNKYPSKYSLEKEITCVQYIIEIVCENEAKRKNVDLPIQFWKIKKWANFYKSQLRQCHKLAKKHGESKLLSFVKKNRIYSLHAKWIDEALLKFEAVVLPNSNDIQILESDQQHNIESSGTPVKIEIGPTKFDPRILSKLRLLDE